MWGLGSCPLRQVRSGVSWPRLLWRPPEWGTSVAAPRGRGKKWQPQRAERIFREWLVTQLHLHHLLYVMSPDSCTVKTFWPNLFSFNFKNTKHSFFPSVSYTATRVFFFLSYLSKAHCSRTWHKTDRSNATPPDSYVAPYFNCTDMVDDVLCSEGTTCRQRVEAGLGLALRNPTSLPSHVK